VKNHPHFDSTFWPSLIPGGLIVLLLWIIQWAQHLFVFPFYTLGVMPKTVHGLIGILTMPLIHDKLDYHHLLNNSVAFVLLMSLLVYSYRSISIKVLFLSWLIGGALVWAFASNHGAYHIGISGVIYSLFGFLFASGLLRRYFPLQALSMLVVFIYGSMIWGIFPLVKHVSWEGHLAGILTGVVLAFVFRKQGPQRPKYQYEIEREMGIEPPDFEAELAKANEAETPRVPPIIVYHYRPNVPIIPLEDTTPSTPQTPE
jgi:membrane associated rhomboid family serine protease